jgi:hypothetical protein
MGSLLACSQACFQAILNTSRASTTSVSIDFERVLRNDESMLSVARYILENPVRAGLVARVEDYPFVGSQTHPLSEILEVIQLMPVTRKTR